MSDAVDAAVFLAGLYSELMFNSMSPGLLPIVCMTDSYSILDALKSTIKNGFRKASSNRIEQHQTDGRQRTD